MAGSLRLEVEMQEKDPTPPWDSEQRITEVMKNSRKHAFLVLTGRI